MKNKTFFPPVYLFLNNNPLDLLLWQLLNEIQSPHSELNNHSIIKLNKQKGISNPLRLILPGKIYARTNYQNVCRDQNIPENRCLVNINLKDVAFISSNRRLIRLNNFNLRPNYQAVVMTNGNVYLLHQRSLSELNNLLPYYFVQINQSVIINILQISGERSNIVYLNNNEFYINESYRKNFHKIAALYRISYS